MKCPRCGETGFKETSKFCPECGLPLKKQVVHEVQAKGAEPSGNDLKEQPSHVQSLPAGKNQCYLNS